MRKLIVAILLILSLAISVTSVGAFDIRDFIESAGVSWETGAPPPPSPSPMIGKEDGAYFVFPTGPYWYSANGNWDNPSCNYGEDAWIRVMRTTSGPGELFVKFTLDGQVKKTVGNIYNQVPNDSQWHWVKLDGPNNSTFDELAMHKSYSYSNSLRIDAMYKFTINCQ